ncbi:hypothetical protein Y1Q_0005419 [Alligator mississippiensis]|uniref:Uncharacterized protein n=1 Tax=Alligator mississippiensis TaxID=8496 RepID=A0A151MZQ5_ALLMI|nr:hypothetical protein Y1Q_0005419 [Alligator mississippiensis]
MKSHAKQRPWQGRWRLSSEAIPPSVHHGDQLDITNKKSLGLSCVVRDLSKDEGATLLSEVGEKLFSGVFLS